MQPVKCGLNEVLQFILPTRLKLLQSQELGSTVIGNRIAEA